MLIDLNIIYTSPQIKIQKDKLDMIFNGYLIIIRDSRGRTLTGRLGAGESRVQSQGSYLGFLFGKVAVGQDSFRVLIFPCQHYCTNTDS